MAAANIQTLIGWLWRRKLALLLVLAVVVAVGAVPDVQSQPAAQTLPLQLSPADVTQVQSRSVGRDVAFTGSLKPWQQTVLSAAFDAQVESFNVRAGDQVHAGEVLAQLDLSEITLRHQQSQAALQAQQQKADQAHEQVTRLQKLFKKGYASDTQYDNAKRDWAIAKAQAESAAAELAQLEEKIHKAKVVAPFDGWVAERSAEPGEMVAAGTPLLQLVDLHLLELEASVPSTDIPLVAPGQQVAFKVNDQVEHVYHGTVKRINPVARQDNRRVAVYAEVNNDDNVLRAGMFVEGKILDGHPVSGLAVPRSALQKTEQGWRLFLIEGNYLTTRPVSLLRTLTDEDEALVSGQLNAGDQVLVMPGSALVAGRTVQFIGGS